MATCGADSINDMDSCGTARCRACVAGIRALYTLGSFMRAFSWGNVLQPGKVNRLLPAQLARRAPLLPAADVAAFDSPPTSTRSLLNVMSTVDLRLVRSAARMASQFRESSYDRAVLATRPKLSDQRAWLCHRNPRFELSSAVAAAYLLLDHHARRAHSHARGVVRQAEIDHGA